MNHDATHYRLLGLILRIRNLVRSGLERRKNDENQLYATHGNL